MSTPMVRARPAGRVTQVLEGIGKAFRSQNSGMDCRWVFDSKTSPSLSNVTSRMAEGYRKVLPVEVGDAGFPIDSEEKEVRVADVILMCMPEGQRQSLMMERANLAKEQARSIDRNYYRAIDEMEVGGGRLGEKHRPRPMGRSVIEEREFSYDVEQRTGEER